MNPCFCCVVLTIWSKDVSFNFVISIVRVNYFVIQIYKLLAVRELIWKKIGNHNISVTSDTELIKTRFVNLENEWWNPPKKKQSFSVENTTERGILLSKRAILTHIRFQEWNTDYFFLALKFGLDPLAHSNSEWNRRRWQDNTKRKSVAIIY